MNFKLWLENNYEQWLKEYEAFEPIILRDPLVQQELATVGDVKTSTIQRVLIANKREDLGQGLTTNVFNKRHNNQQQQQAYAKQQAEISLRERQDQFYYHVLPKSRLKRVMKQGLVPGSPAVFTNYTNHSEGRIFLCEKEGINFWKERIESHLFHNDQSQKLSVVRIPKSVVKVEVDPVGTKDSYTPSYFTTTPVSPKNIEIYE